jgi:glucose-1-phosphate cytidylyltransferase
MKAVILAGGLGTRLSEETTMRPKPMIEIAGRPILWHIMKIYSAHGINDFIICAGYKSHVIKDFFASYALHSSDVTFDLKNKTIQSHNNAAEDWRVTVVDTGEHTQTGGRLKRVQSFLDEDEPFCFTYGDAVSDIDITALVTFHKQHGLLATVTGVLPVARYGRLITDEQSSVVQGFEEKPTGEGGWVSGGFFVLSPKVIDYIPDDHEPWERGPMQILVRRKELAAYQFRGFWQSMDTQRDKILLDELWLRSAPWKKW